MVRGMRDFIRGSMFWDFIGEGRGGDGEGEGRDGGEMDFDGL